MLASLKKKETYEHYLETLKFALYCITHPLDGFWDLTHEKRGSILLLTCLLIYLSCSIQVSCLIRYIGRRKIC